MNRSDGETTGESSDNLWSELVAAGLTDAPAPDRAASGSPWFIKIIVGFCGWLAALFVLTFFGLVLQSLLENSLLSAVSGGLMITVTGIGLRKSRNDFIEQTMIAVNLAGQGLIAWALFSSGFIAGGDDLFWGLLALMQLTIAILIPDFFLRVLAIFGVVFALSFIFIPSLTYQPFAGTVTALSCWVWLNEFRFSRHIETLQTAGYGLVLAVIYLNGMGIAPDGSLDWLFTDTLNPSHVQPWVGAVIGGLVTLYVTHQLLQKHDHAPASRFGISAYAGALLVTAASWFIPGLHACILFLLLGFAAGNRILSGIGIAALLLNISSYYYLLEASLPAKALSLLIAGLVLLAVRWQLLRVFPAGEEA